MRLFIALDFPDAVRETLRELIQKLRPEARGAKWVRPESMHVTLKFLGETEPARLGDIRGAVAAANSPRPVEMRFRGLGFFPHERRPRVLWCGVEASPNLPQLAADVDRSLAAAGFAPESRPFVPHLTLARFESPRGIESLVGKAGEIASTDFGSAIEREFYLFESIRKPSGAEYRRVERFPFVKDGA